MRHRHPRALGTTTLGVVAALIGSVLLAGPAGATSIDPEATGGPSSPAPDASATETTLPDTDPSQLVEVPAIAAEAPSMRADYSSIQATSELVPTDLEAALRRDLDLDPASYLQRAEAATDASAVLDWLPTQGVEVLASRLDGTTLTVSVPAGTDTTAIEAAGAVATTEVPAELDLGDTRFDSVADLVGGSGWAYWNTQGGGSRCSVGFTGFNPSGGQRFITAGHCYEQGDSRNGAFWAISQPAPTMTGALYDQGADLGVPVGNSRFGGGFDGGLVDVLSGWTSKPAVDQWGGGTGAPNPAKAIPIHATGNAVVGQPACKSGASSGWTCGSVLAVNRTISVDDAYDVVSTVTSACAIGGDSGGSYISGSTALGVTSASSWKTNCTRAGQPQANPTSTFWEIKAKGSTDTALFGSGWQPRIAVDEPTLTAPGRVYSGDVIRGTLPDGTTQNRVQVKFDSGAWTTVAVSSSRSWAATVPPLSAGSHTVSVQGTWGSANRSTVLTSSIVVDAKPAVKRIGGAGRIETAVSIAKSAYPGTAPVVYVATSGNYPDALSAASAAASKGGPLLLTDAGALPTVVKDAITKLDPASIVVVGGEAAVSSGVASSLAAIAPVKRIGGPDRWETSRRIVLDAFGATGAATAYLATGNNFPDALSAAAAAGSKKSPVLLVDGGAGSLDASTIATLKTLKTKKGVVVGGTAVVSAGIESSLRSTVGTATRLSGADRYDTSIAINKSSFGSSPVAYLATGSGFADALAGAAVAGAKKAPLYVVPSVCVPAGLHGEFTRLGVRTVTLLGGESALNRDVASLRVC